jgi:hypothetical protein
MVSVRTQTLWNICVMEEIQRRLNEVQLRPTTAAEPGAFFLRVEICYCFQRQWKI